LRVPAKQEKKEEVVLSRDLSKVTEQEPTTVATFAPPTYPGQPPIDRLQKLEQKGGKKTEEKTTEAAKVKKEDDLDVKANVGPDGMLEWLILAGGLAVLLVIGGYAAWKLKPPWLGWLWRLLGATRGAGAGLGSSFPGARVLRDRRGLPAPVYCPSSAPRFP
jgi:hypothetical protein